MKKHLFLVSLLALMVACVPHKKISYLQDVELASADSSSVHLGTVIKTGDILSISISSLNPEASSFFNFRNELGDARENFNNYLVGPDGTIDVPLIGSIGVADKTTKEVRAVLLDQLDKYLTEPIVNVRLDNFQVTVLGEVNRPGVYPIRNEKVTVLEALGLAGDLTIYGKRDNVKIVRELAGKRYTYTLDLTSKALLESPNYYLKNNDVIYVEPSKGRTSIDDNVYRIIPVLVSSLTLILFFLRTTN